MPEPLIVAMLGVGAMLALVAGTAEVIDGAQRAQRRRLREFVAMPLARDGEPGARLSSLPSRIAFAVGRPAVGLWPFALGPEAMHAAAVEVGAATIGFVIGGISAALFAGPNLAALGAAGGALVGLLAPRIAWSRARGRQRRNVIAALPNTLDLMALAADAGLGFDAALAQVVPRLDGPLAAELRRVLVELRIGRDRRLALRELARRTALPETARMTNAIIQADALGLPLTRTFRELASEIRVRRRQLAEEQARTAPIKMLFPMVLLIFPALFVVILGPAVITVVEALHVGP
ncbi:MAG: type II secretion system F family protein [Chloroflexi bacterium]|nr:MAG: type II secretion system F family protein [Chloroflexota bacterium]